MSDELWLKAMKKLETDKSDFSGRDVGIIVGFIDTYKKSIPEGIQTQILRDVSVYKKYDAIAMWVGQGGLIDYEPKFITELVKIFGIEE